MRPPNPAATSLDGIDAAPLSKALEVLIDALATRAARDIAVELQKDLARCAAESARLAEPSLNQGRRLIRRPAVEAMTSIGRTQIYRLIRDGRFPKPVPVGGAVAWVEDEVQAWIEAMIQERDKSDHR